MRPNRRSTLALVALALLLSACGGGDDDGGAVAPADGATVTAQSLEFQPDPITVAAGTTITFRNEDTVDHTVTAGTREDPQPDVFDGQLPEEGATFELTLDEPGTYDYFCEIHPGMKGSVVVE